MENIIFEKFGCQIIERNNKLLIRYDSGEFASKMVEKEITLEEAKIAMLSEEDAYNVIMAALKRTQNKS